MEDLTFSFLSEKQLPGLRQTFLQAFADYLVPIQLSEEQFKAKVQREGIRASFCVAAFVGNEMVGFILTGVGAWQGRPTAYNAGTGVLPAFRGRGLTCQLYQFLLPKLRESGLEQCLLEVLQENAPALKSYERTGFRITRALDCFRAPKHTLLLQADEPDDIVLVPAEKTAEATYRRFWDVAPSWQNDFEAIKRSGAACRTLEARNSQQEVVGYIAFFEKNGAVAQLAVGESWRGRGIGSALLRQAMQQTEAPAILFINIETRATSMIAFLERRHFSRVLKQYEMLLPIV
ncbi:GNAT family N-acetyltransferase [Pontibacter liquoris]|uniref:GNAT family N-acetyltransferase n=1 Tax=Pontibacter liquoris TaxID=2905677 RepID=UPI001FA70037|nr:GNAT family N-acetyltransferase [Pontibacter liquoris]